MRQIVISTKDALTAKRCDDRKRKKNLRRRE